MAPTNTEKPSTKQEKKKKLPMKKVEQSVPKMKTPSLKKEEVKKTEKIKKESEKIKEKPQKKTVKKDYAVVNVKGLPISTKQAVAICKFLKNKRINNAISDLEEVSRMRKAVPMKGEISHKKGKIMSGKYPVKAAKEFIVLLKSLRGNSIKNELENPIISEAIANLGQRPLGRFGAVKRKRTNLKIVARETNKKKSLNNGRYDQKKIKKKASKSLNQKNRGNLPQIKSGQNLN